VYFARMLHACTITTPAPLCHTIDKKYGREPLNRDEATMRRLPGCINKRKEAAPWPPLSVTLCVHLPTASTRIADPHRSHP
jgi:hypothetical protein